MSIVCVCVCAEQAWLFCTKLLWYMWRGTVACDSCLFTGGAQNWLVQVRLKGGAQN